MNVAVWLMWRSCSVDGNAKFLTNQKNQEDARKIKKKQAKKH